MQGPTPEQYNPPLTRWGHGWRLLLALGISAAVWGDVADQQWQQMRGLFWLDLTLGLISFVLMFQRRRWPVAIAVIITAMSMVSGLSSGPSALAAVSLATQRRVAPIIAVSLIGIIGSQVYFDLMPSTSKDPRWINFSFAVAFTIAMMAWGMYVGSRRELFWTLKDRAISAEAQQELRISQARSNERERIAREMHDVLAHRISLVTMHAGALAYRTDLPPEQIRETAALIQAKAHEALVDLREVLGVLRADELPHRPQPTLADLPALVEESIASGMTIELVDHIQGTLPDGLGRTIYRIVQEGLTNARKHAAGTHVEVLVSGEEGTGVEVSLRNPTRVGSWPTTPGAGLGLIGLRERAELAGGTLEITDNAKGFALHGWLPWPAGTTQVDAR